MITLVQIREKLIEEIQNSGMSQAEIARQLGIRSQTVCNYVKGKKMPALDTFANLCKILDVDPAEILCTYD
ncbi:MAG: helix-turn-helix domain-containing protein [Clostridia bacterium]|nr:helix-turn-helix domain-containing protein [Clostridia bacterium]MDE6210522.1 helix-turn-helix domain-containing protein [Clostridia bacterium]MDE6604910.1 helix-turn-helix domain-containing protein [Clostridia bacterium]MDE6869422.1 helix-turn-helix domain-containing protein [Clostridia bacterium]MDE7208982.1 helix-turn-helix domain-containing protein [Clostridia bacterium]